jgi:hypothetical protein
MKTIGEIIVEVSDMVRSNGQCEVYPELMLSVVGDEQYLGPNKHDAFFDIYFYAWKARGYTIRKSNNGVSWMILGETKLEFDKVVDDLYDSSKGKILSKELIVRMKVWNHYSLTQYVVKHNGVETLFVDYADAKYAYSLLKD